MLRLRFRRRKKKEHEKKVEIGKVLNGWLPLLGKKQLCGLSRSFCFYFYFVFFKRQCSLLSDHPFDYELWTLRATIYCEIYILVAFQLYSFIFMPQSGAVFSLHFTNHFVVV